MIHLLTLLLPEENEAETERLLSYLPADSAARIRAYQMPQDRADRAFCEVQFRHLAAVTLGQDALHAPIVRGEWGKPCFPDFPDYHFNYSHTDGRAAIADSRTPIGIDIERVRPMKIEIAERFFTADESAWIRENPAEQDIRFLHVWTRKEAVCKMDGRGFALSPRAFDVLTGEYAARLRTEHIFDSLPGAIAAHMHREPIGSDSLDSDFIGSEYICSVCE